MHNLESKIAHWRGELVAAKIDQLSVLELEGHLLDEINTLVKSGITPDEAFCRAARRIGEPRALAREFAASKPSWAPAFRPAGVLLVVFAGVFTCAVVKIGSKFSRGAITPLLTAHVIILTLAYFGLFAIGAIGLSALVIGLRRSLDETERQSVRRLLFRLTLTCGIALPIGIGLGMTWAARHLGHAWTWAPTQTGAAFAAFSTLLLLLAQWLKLDNQRHCLVAALGSVSLSIGWFGASAVATTAPIAWLCGALAVGQILALRVQRVDPLRC